MLNSTALLLEDSYRYCAYVTRTRARNFHYGLRLLPPEKRRALYAIYTFMRGCDDLADEAPLERRAEGLWILRRHLEDALQGITTAAPVLPAFHDAVTRYRIPGEYLHAVIDGAEMDLRTTRYPTFAALREYCYRVASAVGLVCIHVWGFQGEAACRQAEACGIAFQLTNILRDVREDADRGRVYLPQEDLERFGCSEADLLDGRHNERRLALMRFEAARARDYYHQARGLLSLISPDSRPCLAAMAGIYEGLLDHLERARFPVQGSRARLSTGRKLAIALRAWWRYRDRGGEPPSAP